MSTLLRDKDKEKTKTKSSQEKKKENIVQMSISAEKRLAESVQEVKPKREEWIHPFRNTPYMFVVPRNKTLHRNWLEEWSTLLLDWARKNRIIKISLDKLKLEPIFRCGEYQLDKSGFDLLINYMLKMDLVEWIDQKEKIIRIKWISNDELIDEIYRWAWNSGKTEIDVYQLMKEKGIWSNLNREELYSLLAEMVKKGKGAWLDKKKTIVELYFR